MTADPSYLAPMAADDVYGTPTEEALQEVDRIAPALPRVAMAKPAADDCDPAGLEHDPMRAMTRSECRDAIALANQQQVATVGLSNVAQVAARTWGPITAGVSDKDLSAMEAMMGPNRKHYAVTRGCAPWCGLPYGDKRVPSRIKEVHFASRPFTLRSPAYCCPQTPPDTAPATKEDDRFGEVLLAMRADPEFVGPPVARKRSLMPRLGTVAKFSVAWMGATILVRIVFAILGIR